MAIVSNKKGSKTLLHFTANSGAIVISGNNTVSNITASSDETINSASITKISYGSDVGFWTVVRGANTVAVLSGTNSVDYDSRGIALNLYPTANLACTLNGSANGYILIELHKNSTYTIDDYRKA